MARPNKGAAHVDDLKGSQRSKRRVKVILATLSGEMSVGDACKDLGVGPTQFANLREQMLQGALDALEPRPIGRPPVTATPTPADVEELEDQLIELASEAGRKRGSAAGRCVEKAAGRQGREEGAAAPMVSDTSEREIAADRAKS